MHRRCQDRIRSYLYKTIEQIKSSEIYLNDRKARQHLVHAIAFFKMQLKEDHYFGHYFDRSKARESLDEHDFPGCYEHCPCKLDRSVDVTHVRLFGEERLDSNAKEGWEDGGDRDDTDARRPPKTRRPAEDPPAGEKRREERGQEEDSSEEKCPYQVQSREGKPLVPICDWKGEFKCQGAWNASECSYAGRHRINPYRSREELVLFSTWNLDHKIERSRSLIPQLLKISVQDTVNQTDILDCYDNLFTTKNLRLVHILCHDKEAHK